MSRNHDDHSKNLSFLMDRQGAVGSAGVSILPFGNGAERMPMRKYSAIIIASLALCTGQAHAQRCLPKMQGIEVRANMADGFNPGGNDGGYSFGAALSTYTKKGNKWVFGGE